MADPVFILAKFAFGRVGIFLGHEAESVIRFSHKRVYMASTVSYVNRGHWPSLPSECGGRDVLPECYTLQLFRQVAEAIYHIIQD